ncbi:YdeI/OmpD-associated family protein [Roseivirga sp.]|uniref:YdeI/OmpD-associated family protein n=1 Tax=Roseivirga sp. TaxID=1964215 RepID=UPI003B518E7B
MSFQDKDNAVEARDEKAWRAWLLKNHQQSEGVWLIFYKKESGIESLSYNQAVDQALCFGWIDSRPNKRDHQSSYRYFSPRKPKSNWSRINKQKIERLTKAGLMHESGLRLVQLAKDNGTWDALNEVENLVVPDDLQKALDRFKEANLHWTHFPRSVKRSILEWILNAKKAETRAKRIEETAQLASENIRANQYRP